VLHLAKRRLQVFFFCILVRGASAPLCSKPFAAAKKMAAATTAANGSAAPATATTNGDASPLPPPLVRAFLREDWASIDPILPRALAELRAVGAGECWHKKSSFYAHLLETYKLLTLWGQDAALRNCGLLHSAYSKWVWLRGVLCCVGGGWGRV
jgi:hypothetical protein